MISFKDFYDAYDQAEFGREYGAKAFVNAAEERILVIPSEMVADEEEIEAAETELDSGGWVEFPDQYELHLGQELVFRFASVHLSPVDCQRVRRIFSRRGAYGRWKDLLEEHGLLKNWHEFSETEEINALKNWLEEMGSPFTDNPTAGNAGGAPC